jgi:hypothetical protein
MAFKDKLKAAAALGQEQYEKARAVERRHSEQKQQAAVQQQSMLSAQGILWQGKSHEQGRNSDVTLYANRIERVKEKSRVSLSSAKQDTEVTAIKNVSSVQAKKDGLVFTAVTVFASGNNIVFRLRHEEAQRFKRLIEGLILGETEPASPKTLPVADPVEEIRKFAELRDSGLLSEEEFQAKKQQILNL